MRSNSLYVSTLAGALLFASMNTVFAQGTGMGSGGPAEAGAGGAPTTSGAGPSGVPAPSGSAGSEGIGGSSTIVPGAGPVTTAPTPNGAGGTNPSR
jgi:hypothetical protein